MNNLVLRMVLIPSFLFFAVASMGSSCMGEYEREVTEREGPIGIFLGEDDYEDGDCVPSISFSDSVWKVKMTSSVETVFEAECPQRENCIAFVPPYWDWHSEHRNWDYLTGESYGQDVVFEDFVTHSNSHFLGREDDGKKCNDFFTVTVETAEGEVSRLTYVQYYEYNNYDWGGI